MELKFNNVEYEIECIEKIFKKESEKELKITSIIQIETKNLLSNFGLFALYVDKGFVNLIIFQ